jgi:hypothetical protein
MTRTRVILMALIMGVTPVATSASAQIAPNLAVFASLVDDQRRPDRDQDRERGDRERGASRDRDERRAGPSIDPGQAARAVSSGREGRMLGIRPSGDGYVVRWEYPGGRVADIRVDGSGRVSGG